MSCRHLLPLSSFFFFFNDTATTEIYTLSLHDALPISASKSGCNPFPFNNFTCFLTLFPKCRSEEHTSELQSHSDLVCRLLLEKKKKQYNTSQTLTKRTCPSTPSSPS